MKQLYPIAIAAFAVHAALYPTTVLAAAKSPAQAKQSAPSKESKRKKTEHIETIQIVGSFSESITEANLVKQASLGVSDVIVADDISKFPDNNVAEALQRMTGISIDRNQGEGRFITIRGLGGDYNVTTINGRLMANEEGSRQFSYDTIAAELIGAVQVYKSPEARLAEGGIGGVVDVRTRKPLQLDAFTLNASASASYDARTDRYDPTFSALIGDKSADEHFGYIVSVVHSRRTLRNDGFSAFSYYEPDSYTQELVLPFDVNGDGRIDRSNYWDVHNEGLESTVPPGFQYSSYQDERDRTGLQAAVQWQVNDDWAVDVDAIVNQYQTDGRSNSLFGQYYDNAWYPLETRPVVSNVQRLPDGRASAFTLTGKPSYLVAYDLTPRDVANWLIGGHSRYVLNSAWQLDTDLSHSRALGRNKGDSGSVMMRGFADRIDMARQPGQQLPQVQLTPSTEPFYFEYANKNGTNIDAITDQLQLSATYQDTGLIDQVELGYQWTQQQKGRDYYGIPLEHLSTFSGNNSALTDLQRQPTNAHGYSRFEIPAQYILQPNFSPLFGGHQQTPNPWPGFDLAAMPAFYQSISAQGAANMLPQLDPKNSYRVQEQLHAFYVQGNISLADLTWPTQINVGLRAVQTKTKVNGHSQDYSGIRFNAEKKPVAGSYDPNALTTIATNTQFWDLLPSVTIRSDISDSLVARWASAVVIGRPAIDYLAPYAAIDFSPYDTPDQMPRMTAGNPALKPEKAHQHDVSLEWYFAKASSLTMALYYKQLQSLIENADVEVGPGLQGMPVAMQLKQPELSNYGARIRGAEIAYQQALTDYVPAWAAGLGFLTNFTFTDTEYDDPAKAGKPFKGVPKRTMNLVVYLDKELYSLRLSFNKTASSLLDHNRWIGGYPFNQAYQQLDFSSSLNLSTSTQLTLNVTNLTNEVGYSYLDQPERLNSYFQFGRVTTLGITTRF